MSNNYQTLWLQRKLNEHAENMALQKIQETGRALPCIVTAVTGSIVTVKFEAQGGPWTLPPLTLPKAESQWMRSPTQIGDFGLTVPADTFLGGVSGQGTGTADLTVNYGNLSTLVWFPVGAVGFTAMPDQNKPWINGPAGAVVGDTAQTVYTLYDHTGKAITVKVPSSGGTLNLGDIASALSASNAAQRNSDAVAFAASIKKMVGNAIQQSAQAAITAGVTNATGWLAGIQSGLPSLSFTDLSSSIAALSAPAGSSTVFIK